MVLFVKSKDQFVLSFFTEFFRLLSNFVYKKPSLHHLKQEQT